MIHRDPPSQEECIEALQVMIEAYGYHRTEKMLNEAQELLRKERKDD